MPSHRSQQARLSPGFRGEARALLERAATLAAELREHPIGAMPSAADRLEGSVVRPLGDLVGTPTERESAQSTRQSKGRREREASDRLIDLAEGATQLRARGRAPVEIIEATAALQDLAYAVAAERIDGTARLAAALGKLQEEVPAGIQVSPDGPYLLTNATELLDHLGEPIETRPQMALCRCGGSAGKPLCDGSHARIGYSGAQDPNRVPDRRDTYVGEQITIFDNRGICAHSGFCTDRLASVFHTSGDPFVTASGGRMDEIIRAVRDCPSGALSFAISAHENRDEVDQADRQPSVLVSKDGPYRVTGGIPLTDEAGEAVPPAEGASVEHYSLCRCGQSHNKPFCSGRHWYVNFADPPPVEEPSLFQWAGGLPALTRFARAFLEKLVPGDPSLAPLFAEVPRDIAQREAAWLGHVFGRSSSASTAQDTSDPLAAQVAGKGLTEQQRRRWVELVEQSADEAGLASEPEFRAAFGAYHEWRLRAVLAASQAGNDLSATSTVIWDWTPAGRPPAAGATGAAVEERAPSLPGPDEPIGFAEHIKPLFRVSDQEAMKWAFDLTAYADVSGNAAAILQRLRAGSMPCDGPWPSALIDVFRRWMEAGMPESAGTVGAVHEEAVEHSTVAAEEKPISGRLASLIKLRSGTPEGDRPLVIEHREPLIYMLCSAAELEHALMCEYLFAAFTLKRSTDEGLSEDQLETVERWRQTLLGVAKQEMLHLAINCNLVSALGASPHLSRPNLPQPAKHYPSGVRLELLPFGEQALRHFLYLERPEGMDFDDAEGLAAVECALPVMSEREIVPHLQEFATVGHLYRSIEAGFRHLAEKFGEDQLFVVPPTSQVGGDLFGWTQLRPVTCIDDVVQAIETIVEQGEGPRGDWRNAHFGRFLSVLDEYLAMRVANPGVEFARPVLPALVRPPESGEPADLISDPKSAGVADLGNVAYEVLLQLLYRLLSRVDENDEQMKILSQVAVGLMFDVIEPLGEILTTLPVGPEHPDRTAGPSFELFYQPDYLLPHRTAAWLIMAEHLSDAADLAEAQGDGEPRLNPVADALRRHAGVLRASCR